MGGQLETAGQGFSYGKGSSGGGQAGGSGSAGQYGSDHHHHQGSGFGAGGAGGPGVQAGRGGAPGIVGTGEPGTGKHSHKYLIPRAEMSLGMGPTWDLGRGRMRHPGPRKYPGYINVSVSSTGFFFFPAFSDSVTDLTQDYHYVINHIQFPGCYTSDF